MGEVGLPVPKASIVPAPTSAPDSVLFDLDISRIPCFVPLPASPSSKLSEAIVYCCSDSRRLPEMDLTFVCWGEVDRRGCGIGVGGGEGIGASGLVAVKSVDPAIVSSVD